MKKMKFNRSWSDVAIVAIITLAITALFAPLIVWAIQMYEEDVQNMNTYARCNSAGGQMGYSKCYKDGREI